MKKCILTGLLSTMPFLLSAQTREAEYWKINKIVATSTSADDSLLQCKPLLTHFIIAYKSYHTINKLVFAANFPQQLKQKLIQKKAHFEEVNWKSVNGSLNNQMAYAVLVPLFIYSENIDCNGNTSSQDFLRMLKQGLGGLDTGLTRNLVFADVIDLRISRIK